MIPKSASNGTRTHDPRITNALLYHLSHRSILLLYDTTTYLKSQAQTISRLNIVQYG